MQNMAPEKKISSEKVFHFRRSLRFAMISHGRKLRKSSRILSMKVFKYGNFLALFITRNGSPQSLWSLEKYYGFPRYTMVPGKDHGFFHKNTIVAASASNSTLPSVSISSVVNFSQVISFRSSLRMISNALHIY